MDSSKLCRNDPAKQQYLFFSDGNSNILHSLAISFTVLFKVLYFKLHSAFTFFLLGMGMLPTSLSLHSSFYLAEYTHLR